MRWKGRQGSSNIEDRRGGRGGGGMRSTRGRIGIGTVVLALAAALFFGTDPMEILEQQAAQSQSMPQTQSSGAQPNDELGAFVSVVLKDTEDVWNKLFREQLGRNYREPTLVYFSGQTMSGCGRASSATGPFYCPADEKIYIDLSFYQQLKNRFGAPGDFAMAFVVAHEVAHHVQNLLDITDQVDAQRGRVSKQQYNQLSVRLELQADFLAGVWANHAQRMKNILEEGDVEEAMRAAHAIGDDFIQKRSQGYVVPASFTHGTSEQRKRWFSKGLRNGDLRQGDTFDIPYRNL
jgi:predicted metalloprotease